MAQDFIIKQSEICVCNDNLQKVLQVHKVQISYHLCVIFSCIVRILSFVQDDFHIYANDFDNSMQP